MVDYRYKRGEDVIAHLDIPDEDALGDYTNVSAAMRKWQGGSIQDDTPKIAMTATPRAGDPDGFDIELAASESADLEEGVYQVDAQYTYGGKVHMTERSLIIEIEEAATSPVDP